MARRAASWILGSAFVFVVVANMVACSGTDSNPGFTDDDSGGGDDNGDDGGAASGDDSGSASDGKTGTSDGGSKSDGGVADAGGLVAFDSGHGFGLIRAACFDEINRLRATEGHAAYTLWSGAPIETCLDQQSTYDETQQVAHDAWNTSKYPTCNGNAQDECEGYPLTVAGITKCIDDMWNEKTKPNCAGCSAAACQANYTPNCANCDYSGTKGYECGHYVNMSADWLKKGNCGFSTYTGSTTKGTHPFAVQNFSQ